VTWVLMTDEFALRSDLAVDYRWFGAAGPTAAHLRHDWSPKLDTPQKEHANVK
jgi:hypothetical protein